MAETFQVITQRQQIGRLPDNTYGPVMTVTFRTAAGVVSSVDVPAQDYTAETVRQIIEAHVAEVDAVQNL